MELLIVAKGSRSGPEPGPLSELSLFQHSTGQMYSHCKCKGKKSDLQRLFCSLLWGLFRAFSPIIMPSIEHWEVSTCSVLFIVMQLTWQYVASMYCSLKAWNNLILSWQHATLNLYGVYKMIWYTNTHKIGNKVIGSPSLKVNLMSVTALKMRDRVEKGRENEGGRMRKGWLTLWESLL